LSESGDSAGHASDQEIRSLRVIRAERLLSIRELGLLAGVAPSTIYMIESGRSTPRPSVVRCICDALQVDAMAVTEFRRAIRAHGGSR
jgi:DNA-binding XRE family transcriptional regulator